MKKAAACKASIGSNNHTSRLVFLRTSSPPSSSSTPSPTSHTSSKAYPSPSCVPFISDNDNSQLSEWMLRRMRMRITAAAATTTTTALRTSRFNARQERPLVVVTARREFHHHRRDYQSSPHGDNNNYRTSKGTEDTHNSSSSSSSSSSRRSGFATNSNNNPNQNQRHRDPNSTEYFHNGEVTSNDRRRSHRNPNSTEYFHNGEVTSNDRRGHSNGRDSNQRGRHNYSDGNHHNQNNHHRSDRDHQQHRRDFQSDQRFHRSRNQNGDGGERSFSQQQQQQPLSSAAVASASSSNHCYHRPNNDHHRRKNENNQNDHHHIAVFRALMKKSPEALSDSPLPLQKLLICKAVCELLMRFVKKEGACTTSSLSSAAAMKRSEQEERAASDSGSGGTDGSGLPFSSDVQAYYFHQSAVGSDNLREEEKARMPLASHLFLLSLANAAVNASSKSRAKFYEVLATEMGLGERPPPPPPTSSASTSSSSADSGIDVMDSKKQSKSPPLSNDNCDDPNESNSSVETFHFYQHVLFPWFYPSKHKMYNRKFTIGTFEKWLGRMAMNAKLAVSGGAGDGVTSSAEHHPKAISANQHQTACQTRLLKEAYRSVVEHFRVAEHYNNAGKENKDEKKQHAFALNNVFSDENTHISKQADNSTVAASSAHPTLPPPQPTNRQRFLKKEKGCSFSPPSPSSLIWWKPSVLNGEGYFEARCFNHSQQKMLPLALPSPVENERKQDDGTTSSERLVSSFSDNGIDSTSQLLHDVWAAVGPVPLLPIRALSSVSSASSSGPEMSSALTPTLSSSSSSSSKGEETALATTSASLSPSYSVDLWRHGANSISRMMKMKMAVSNSSDSEGRPLHLINVSSSQSFNFVQTKAELLRCLLDIERARRKSKLMDCTTRLSLRDSSHAFPVFLDAEYTQIRNPREIGVLQLSFVDWRTKRKSNGDVKMVSVASTSPSEHVVRVYLIDLQALTWMEEQQQREKKNKPSIEVLKSKKRLPLPSTARLLHNCIFANPSIVVCMHGGSNDVTLLKQRCGIHMLMKAKGKNKRRAADEQMEKEKEEESMRKDFRGQDHNHHIHHHFTSNAFYDTGIAETRIQWLIWQHILATFTPLSAVSSTPTMMMPAIRAKTKERDDEGEKDDATSSEERSTECRDQKEMGEVRKEKEQEQIAEEGRREREETERRKEKEAESLEGVVTPTPIKQSAGLATLMRRYSCGADKNVAQQVQDWSVRPLPTEAMAYAADDVRYLPRVFYSQIQLIALLEKEFKREGDRGEIKTFSPSSSSIVMECLVDAFDQIKNKSATVIIGGCGGNNHRHHSDRQKTSETIAAAQMRIAMRIFEERKKCQQSQNALAFEEQPQPKATNVGKEESEANARQHNNSKQGLSQDNQHLQNVLSLFFVSSKDEWFRSLMEETLSSTSSSSQPTRKHNDRQQDHFRHHSTKEKAMVQQQQHYSSQEHKDYQRFRSAILKTVDQLQHALIEGTIMGLSLRLSVPSASASPPSSVQLLNSNRRTSNDDENKKKSVPFSSNSLVSHRSPSLQHILSQGALMWSPKDIIRASHAEHCRLHENESKISVGRRNDKEESETVNVPTLGTSVMAAASSPLLLLLLPKPQPLDLTLTNYEFLMTTVFKRVSSDVAMEEWRRENKRRRLESEEEEREGTTASFSSHPPLPSKGRGGMDIGPIDRFCLANTLLFSPMEKVSTTTNNSNGSSNSVGNDTTTTTSPRRCFSQTFAMNHLAVGNNGVSDAAISLDASSPCDGDDDEREIISLIAAHIDCTQTAASRENMNDNQHRDDNLTTAGGGDGAEDENKLIDVDSSRHTCCDHPRQRFATTTTTATIRTRWPVKAAHKLLIQRSLMHPHIVMERGMEKMRRMKNIEQDNQIKEDKKAITTISVPLPILLTHPITVLLLSRAVHLFIATFLAMVNVQPMMKGSGYLGKNYKGGGGEGGGDQSGGRGRRDDYHQNSFGDNDGRKKGERFSSPYQPHPIFNFFHRRTPQGIATLGTAQLSRGTYAFSSRSHTNNNQQQYYRGAVLPPSSSSSSSMSLTSLASLRPINLSHSADLAAVVYEHLLTRMVEIERGRGREMNGSDKKVACNDDDARNAEDNGKGVEDEDEAALQLDARGQMINALFTQQDALDLLSGRKGGQRQNSTADRTVNRHDDTLYSAKPGTVMFILECAKKERDLMVIMRRNNSLAKESRSASSSSSVSPIMSVSSPSLTQRPIDASASLLFSSLVLSAIAYSKHLLQRAVRLSVEDSATAAERQEKHRATVEAHRRARVERKQLMMATKEKGEAMASGAKEASASAAADDVSGGENKSHIGEQSTRP